MSAIDAATVPTVNDMLTPDERDELVREANRRSSLLAAAVPSIPTLPDEIFISQTETLPRELVTACAKSRCRRCGAQGWFILGGNALACPCTAKRVAASVQYAKTMLEQKAATEAAK